MSFCDGVVNNLHELFVISFFVLEIFHEFKVLQAEKLVEGQMFDICFEQLFGIVEIFIVSDDELGIFD
jgi:hypothetical protein